MPKYNSLYERLVAGVAQQLIENEQSCWIWNRNKNAKGYGRLTIRRLGRHLKVYAHRLMCELIHGPAPEGYEADHLCFNTSCINPDHLRWISAPDNNARRPQSA